MVRGEETNVFSNTLGKTVVVEVRPSCPETTELLSVVLDNDVETAQLLAIEIHREITLAEVPIDGTLDDCDVDIDINDLGIWIDPIGKEKFIFSYYKLLSIVIILISCKF